MIFFLIPVFNEEKNIPNLLSSLAKLALEEDEIKIIFSDDGSTDKSIEKIKECCTGQNYVIIGDGNNIGPGNAFNLGFEWVLQHSKSKNDSVITLEADGTSDLSLLPQMIILNKLGYSLVLASVYAQGGGFEQTSFFRRLISVVANLFFRFVFNLKTLTLSSFYRCYSVALLSTIYEKYNGKIIQENGFICMLEVLLKAVRCNARIIEIPMILKSSKRIGKSKMKILKTSYEYIRFLLQFNYKREN